MTEHVFSDRSCQEYCMTRCLPSSAVCRYDVRDAITYLKGEWPARASDRILPRPH
ncbi:uncharacterized protein M421DRAFT_333330 [Didymella exigua CBS 183.55]|uniref:Sema domain-containing protein n=1 Tax=Didymella exigua CBS 183.55 TaxID=1150837 RepID=A0A6A5R4R0_9PLEO|nr:uncharacterized protein M421DRAFT_333330 [Didymella exigua CBS 183.55]KAF1923095.1 hypothetical protein M421DRAFT_333330 [Didymella exigua CBS 183.55]